MYRQPEINYLYAKTIIRFYSKDGKLLARGPFYTAQVIGGQLNVIKTAKVIPCLRAGDLWRYEVKDQNKKIVQKGFADEFGLMLVGVCKGAEIQISEFNLGIKNGFPKIS